MECKNLDPQRDMQNDCRKPSNILAASVSPEEMLSCDLLMLQPCDPGMIRFQNLKGSKALETLDICGHFRSEAKENQLGCWPGSSIFPRFWWKGCWMEIDFELPTITLSKFCSRAVLGLPK